jgi:hypothetical protein
MSLATSKTRALYQMPPGRMESGGRKKAPAAVHAKRRA